MERNNAEIVDRQIERIVDAARQRQIQASSLFDDVVNSVQRLGNDVVDAVIGVEGYSRARGVAANFWNMRFAWSVGKFLFSLEMSSHPMLRFRFVVAETDDDGQSVFDETFPWSDFDKLRELLARYDSFARESDAQ